MSTRRKKVIRKGQELQPIHTQLYDKITRIESQVLDRIQKLKSHPRPSICEHFTGNQEEETYDEDKNYYDLCWKQFILNDLGLRQVRLLKGEVSQFRRKLNKIDKLFRERERELRPYVSRKPKVNEEGELVVPCVRCQEEGTVKMFLDREAMMIHLRIKHNIWSDQKSNNSQQYFQESQEHS